MSRHAALHLINTILGGVKKHADDYRRATRVLRPVVRVVSSVSFIINLICSIMTAAARRSHLSCPNVTPLCVASPSVNPLPATSASVMLSPVASVCRDIILFLSASAGHIFTWKDGACAYAVADRSKTSLLSVAKNLSLPSCSRVAISNFETNKLTNNLIKMKRNLLKTVLVAVGLVAGMSSAWAQDGTKQYQYVGGVDFEDDSWSAGWTIGGNITNVRGKRTKTDGSTSQFFHVKSGLGKDRDNTYNINNQDFLTAEDWKLEFDWAAYTSNKNNIELCVYDNNETKGKLFYISVGSWATTASICTSDGTVLTPTSDLDIDRQNSSTRGEDISVTKWWHFVLTGNSENGVLLSIMNAAGSYILQNQKVSEFSNASGFNLHVANNLSQMSIDDIQYFVYSDTEVVAAPEARISAINGEKRTVTITTANASHNIYYYYGEDADNPIKYEAPIVVETSAEVHYYAQSESGTKSEVKSISVTCVPVVLTAPTYMRTDEKTYKISTSQPTVDGLVASPTIYYAVAGEEDKIVPADGVINNISSDFDIWTVCEGYTSSERVTVAYVPAYQTKLVWTIDVNSYPKTNNVDNIANAIDEATEKDFNGLVAYNLKNVDCPNFYVENSTGWLLRTQTANAFKVQYAKTSIVIDNVNTDNVIYIVAVDDQGRYRIDNVVNGTVKYSYNNSEYFIVPNEDGAVTIKFSQGVCLNTVSVNTTKETVTIPGNAFATYCPAYPVEFAADGAIEAYKASVDEAKRVVNLTRIYQVAAGEGVLVHAKSGETATEEVNIIAPIAKDASNAFVGTLEGLIVDDSNYGTVYFLGNGSKGLGFYKAANGGTLAAGKAYLSLPATSEAKSYSIAFGGDTTGINEVVATAKADGAYYTLSGVRVENPTKGLYIQNGKKVIIK